MTSMLVMDADHSPAGIKRRMKEELARCGYASETRAAERYGVPQQWVSRRMTGETPWKIDELSSFCDVLGLSYVYVTTGIRLANDPPRPPVSPHRQDIEAIPRLYAVAAPPELADSKLDDNALAMLRLIGETDKSVDMSAPLAA